VERRARYGRIAHAHIHGALFVAFFTYANTMSLVLTGEDARALERLFSEHLGAFLTFRDGV
jgi:hypothetical protein